MPRVSVVVPTYNRAYLLRDTLPTLLAQSEQDIEIVIVDSASTDGTVDLVERAHDPRLRLVPRRASHATHGKLDASHSCRPWGVRGPVS